MYIGCVDCQARRARRLLTSSLGPYRAFYLNTSHVVAFYTAQLVASRLVALAPVQATGSAPTAAFAASVAFGHDVYLYGGHDGSGVTGELHRLQGGRMKWSAPDTTGNGPPACAGAAAAIAAHTFLIYGGYGEAGTDAPLDCFHVSPALPLPLGNQRARPFSSPALST